MFFEALVYSFDNWEHITHVDNVYVIPRLYFARIAYFIHFL